MLEKAVEKLRSEMSKNNNPYVQVVGQFLIQHVTANPKDAEKFLTEGKTITGSLDAMRKVAEGKKVGNMAVITPEEGFGVVMKYFGIEPIGVISIVTDTISTIEHKPESVAMKSIDFDVSLEDFM